MLWLVILALVAVALVAAALIDARNKRLGITVDAEEVHQRRKEQGRQARRALLPRARRVRSDDDDPDRDPVRED